MVRGPPARGERRRRGIFGPQGNQRGVVFADDISSAARDTYGAQPPLELLRQWVETDGWHDTRSFAFRQLVDLALVGAMRPAYRTAPPPERFLRHFAMLGVPQPADAAIAHLFRPVLRAAAPAARWVALAPARRIHAPSCPTLAARAHRRPPRRHSVAAGLAAETALHVTDTYKRTRTVFCILSRRYRNDPK